MFRQSRDPNNKVKPANEKYCSCCHRTNNSISAGFKKHGDDEDIRDAYARSKSPQKSFLQYSNKPLTTEQTDMIHATEAEVLHELLIISKIHTHKTDIALHPDTESVMTEILLLHNTLEHDTTTTKEIHDHTALLTDLLTDPRIDMTLVKDIDQVHLREMTTLLQDTHRPQDHLQDQELLDILDHVHIQTQEINLIQYNHNTKQTQLTLKYTYISQML